jgi:phosphatidate cytidylyltransferase
MLGQRVITAVALLAVFGGVVVSKSFAAFSVLVAVTVTVAAWEWDRMRGDGYLATMLLGALFVMGLVAWLVLPGSGLAESVIKRPVGVFAASIFWLLAWPLYLRVPSRDVLRSWYGKALTFILLGAAFFAALYLYERNPTMLLAAVCVPFVADSFAYFVGRKIGRRKLAPLISPGKTLEGAIGGLIAVALVYGAWVFSAGWHWWWGLIFVFLGALSIIGDLFESLLKRQAGVKDSSNLLPGHGGVLDRIDAQLPVLPLAALAFQSLPLK